jgi:hypoxanthine phosphoribosyltransferase
MLDISFRQIQDALSKIELPACELVVGIADGGIVPASIIAYKLSCDLKIVKINYRDSNNLPQYPAPVLSEQVSFAPGIKKILIVDDASVSGMTLDTAKKIFRGSEVKTMVFKGKADYVLFPQIKDCVNWPWKT